MAHGPRATDLVMLVRAPAHTPASCTTRPQTKLFLAHLARGGLASRVASCRMNILEVSRDRCAEKVAALITKKIFNIGVGDDAKALARSLFAASQDIQHIPLTLKIDLGLMSEIFEAAEKGSQVGTQTVQTIRNSKAPTVLFTFAQSKLGKVLMGQVASKQLATSRSNKKQSDLKELSSEIEKLVAAGFSSGRRADAAKALFQNVRLFTNIFTGPPNALQEHLGKARDILVGLRQLMGDYLVILLSEVAAVFELTPGSGIDTEAERVRILDAIEKFSEFDKNCLQSLVACLQPIEGAWAPTWIDDTGFLVPLCNVFFKAAEADPTIHSLTSAGSTLAKVHESAQRLEGLRSGIAQHLKDRKDQLSFLGDDGVSLPDLPKFIEEAKAHIKGKFDALASSGLCRSAAVTVDHLAAMKVDGGSLDADTIKLFLQA